MNNGRGGIALAEALAEAGSEHAQVNSPLPAGVDEEHDSAATAAGSGRTGRHRRSRAARGDRAGVPLDRMVRVRLLLWSAVGVAGLLVAHRLQPDQGALFAVPSGLAGWTSLLCGIVGIWLVPGLLLSGVMMRTGAGLAAWLGSRLATTLCWYALVGPVIHFLGQGAQVTTGGILIATTAAAAATSLGVALGLARRPARRWLRIVLSAAAGALCAKATIWVWMSVWTYGMNYAHIRRLEWLIVLAGAALSAVGTVSRPQLPVRTARNVRVVLVALTLTAATLATIAVADDTWPPGQQMPSALGIEAVSAPADADIAFALTGIGPEGSRFVEQAEFVGSDDIGRAVPLQTRVVPAADTATATLLVTLEPGTQPTLCRPGRRAKLTLRDQVSGVQVQALVPDGWCAV